MAATFLPDTQDARLAALRELAKAHFVQGRLRESLAAHEEALRIAPDAVIVHLSAARIAHALELQELSLEHFEAAARADPRCHPAVEGARRICVGAGLTDRAEVYSQWSNRLQPAALVPLVQRLIVPSIMPSVQEISSSRVRYAQAIDTLLSSSIRLDQPGGELGVCGFFLAYQGENDRDLQMALAQAFRRLIPSLEYTAPHCRRKSPTGSRFASFRSSDTPASERGASPNHPQRKIRIGFISRFFAAHSIFSTSIGLIEHISRDRFEVIALRITPSRDDDCTSRIRRAADRTLDLDPDLYRTREQIAALELDVLFYQDIGMEPMSYFLSFARLAPVQCVSFGHPNTTGVSTIDYFISNEAFEPPDARTHYSEKLVRLRGLPTLAYYYEPKIPTVSATADSFGLPPAATLYVCPQTLFKLHPEFDSILGRILDRDALGIVVLIEGQFKEFTRILRERLARSIDRCRARVIFLPFMAFERFMQLLAIADVVLDTPHFNGMNSSLQAFAVGAPIVTLPGRLQRGRHTQAMYRHMGILEGIASDPDEYVEIATRIGTDREFSRSLRERILQRKHLLFEDVRVLREFERFFAEAAREPA